MTSISRRFLLAGLPLAGTASTAFAHHGFVGFDISKTYYIEGTIKTLEWGDPHIEVDLSVPAGLAVPADIASIEVPKAEVVMTIPTRLEPLPTSQPNEIWDLTLPSLGRAKLIGLEKAMLEPGRQLAGIGYVGCKREEKAFRPDILLVGRRAFVMRPFPLPEKACS